MRRRMCRPKCLGRSRRHLKGGVRLRPGCGIWLAAAGCAACTQRQDFRLQLCRNRTCCICPNCQAPVNLVKQKKSRETSLSGSSAFRRDAILGAKQDYSIGATRRVYSTPRRCAPTAGRRSTGPRRVFVPSVAAPNPPAPRPPHQPYCSTKPQRPASKCRRVARRAQYPWGQRP